MPGRLGCTVLWALLLFVEPGAAQGVAEADLVRLAAELREAVVGIRPLGPDSEIVGSAVVVSASGWVLTAGHCIETIGAVVHLAFRDGRLARARCHGRAKGEDCGLLKIVEDGPWPWVKLGDEAELTVGAPCLALGHPAGTAFVPLRSGRVSRLPDRRRPYLQTSCRVEPGDSGGGLFDGDGRLIGIHSHIGEGLHQNFHASIGSFKRLKKRLEADEDIEGNGRMGSTESSAGDGPSLGLGVVEIRGALRVNTVKAGRAGARAGLRPLDFLTHLDGIRLDGTETLRELLARRAGGDAVRLTVRRGETVLDLRLDLDGEPPPMMADSKSRAALRVETERDGLRVDVLATVVGPDRVVAKASELGSRCELFLDGALRPLRRLGSCVEDDLALLVVDGVTLSVPTFGVDFDFAPGRDVVVSDALGRARSTGVVSIEPHPLIRSDRELKPFIGVEAIAWDELDGALLSKVLVNSPAKEAGLAVDDLVVAIDGRAIAGPSELSQALATTTIGAAVVVVVLRGHENRRIEVTVVPEAGPRPSMDGGGPLAGELSRRRGEFSLVFRHDAVVHPHDCGGPALDRDGRVVGINIARASRTATLALPIRHVLESVARMEAPSHEDEGDDGR